MVIGRLVAQAVKVLVASDLSQLKKLKNYLNLAQSATAPAPHGVLGISGGIPTRNSNVTGFPSRNAGLNFHRLSASRAASSI